MEALGRGEDVFLKINMFLPSLGDLFGMVK